ncbi:DUF6537 domain-containing protein [Roseisalinus antarcticus]|uniref:Indolepyruvate ferredoxin oxidoreductase n=1 Tax=Roseisalinus antarcticus TaxID=254357 RepID=A0A1Y5TUF6_9RHOB|nr:DUF6537 domain-containing protein [Roseisalinus antarcticus]SLN68333.1 indolepyruvate ferredoxin oxidoreductase [Roseisalinus antarcticus]
MPAAGAATNIVLAGIGGTGVITVSHILSRAAGLEGLSLQSLDETGLSQKNGAVVSHLRLADGGERLHAPRIAPGAADVLLAFDPVTALGAKVAPLLAAGRTRVLADTHIPPTAAIARSGGRAADSGAILDALRAMAPGQSHDVPATRAAEGLLGNAIAANMVMLGHAWQRGLIPVGRPAMEAAIGAGRAGEANLRAFAFGRWSATDPAALEGVLGPVPSGSETLDALIARGVAHLEAWQNRRIAGRWRRLVEAARAAEVGQGLGEDFTRAVAVTGLRLMAYKDEYEVARLYRSDAFRAQLAKAFGGDAAPRVHMAPPLLPLGRDGRTGRPRKIALGRSARWTFAVLVRLKELRGTPFDPFGHTAERRAERRLAREFRALAEALTQELTAETHARAVETAELGQMVRGFGPVKAEAMARYASALAALRAQ